ncbi:MAG TPA: VOC family protein, partial [Burkholderiales bacterium]
QKPPAGELFVDHVSHFVRDLGAAARACEALGLKVTPVSVQQTAEGPIGASNRCVMLEEGYIELLSPTHDTPPARRMRALMARHQGVHLACFGTPDAEGEHRRLAAHGFAPQPMLQLERRVPGGKAKFRVVRCAPEKMPEGRVQFVQQLTPEHLWKPADVNPLRLDEVFVVAEDPAASAARWGEFAALLPRADGKCIRLETARGSVVIGVRKVLKEMLGDAPPAPAIAGYSLRCSHPKAQAERCKEAGIAVRKIGKRYAAQLPAAIGGVFLFG